MASPARISPLPEKLIRGTRCRIPVAMSQQPSRTTPRRGLLLNSLTPNLPSVLSRRLERLDHKRLDRQVRARRQRGELGVRLALVPEGHRGDVVFERQVTAARLPA